MQTGKTIAAAAVLLAAHHASAAPDWTIRFEGHDADGPLSGALVLSLAKDEFGYQDTETILDNGARQRHVSTPYNTASLTLTRGSGAPQVLHPYAAGATATLGPDGTSQLTLGWSTWAERIDVHDWLGITGPDVVYGGTLYIASSSDELFTGLLGPWQSVTGATGETTVDASAYVYRQKYDSYVVPGYNTVTPFTVDAVSSVPEPAAWSLLLPGVATLAAIGRTRGGAGRGRLAPRFRLRARPASAVAHAPGTNPRDPHPCSPGH